MRIAVIADTHDRYPDWLPARLREADEIWHAGDFGELTVSDRLSALKPFRGVYGNIDDQKLRSVHPEHDFFEVEKMKVLMIHIAGPFGSYSPQTRKLVEEVRPDVLVCGHSHILKVQFDTKNKLLYLNPGAAGKHGFHKVRTLLRFTVDGDRLKDLEAVELGARGSL